MSKGEVLIYQGKDGLTQMSVKLEDETGWLNQNQLADLFQTTKQNIVQHIKNILAEGELEAEATVKEFLYSCPGRQAEREKVGGTLQPGHDHLRGYRVNSHVGVHFRRWATERLREYIFKGFVLDDARLKQARDGYFDELLGRIRDIAPSPERFGGVRPQQREGVLPEGVRHLCYQRRL